MLGLPYGLCLVELPAKRFYLAVELVRFQNLIQSVIEGVARRLDHILRCDPELLLPFPLLSHRHVQETFTTFTTSHVVEEKTTIITGCLWYAFAQRTFSRYCEKRPGVRWGNR
jgi:hypothetical protein